MDGVGFVAGKQDLSMVLAKAKKPVNSNGKTFDNVQAAIDDLVSDGWVYVPAGTYNEAVSISGDNVILFGSGWGTIIDGGAGGGHGINITGDYATIKDLTVKTTPGGGNAYDGIYISGTHAKILNIFVNGSDRNGIFTGTGAFYPLIFGCYIYDPDNFGISLDSINTRVLGNRIEQTGVYGIATGPNADNTMINCNDIETTGDDGIYLNANGENCVVVGNRITGYGIYEAIDDDSLTSTVASNETT